MEREKGKGREVGTGLKINNNKKPATMI